MKSRIVLALASALPLGCAWLLPETLFSVVLGWLAAILLCALVRNPLRPYSALYLCGIVSISLGFYWLIHTISDFGGFAFSAAFGVFLLFVLANALQFVLFGIIARRLPRGFDIFSCRCAFAWCATETIFPNIFPWEFAHTQLAFIPFIQVADIGGTALISFLMFWLAEVVARGGLPTRQSVLAYASVGAALIYGFILQSRYMHESLLSDPKAHHITTAVVQANVTVAEKHNVAYFLDNSKRYQELSLNVAGPDTLVVWPESAIMDAIYTKIDHLPGSGRVTPLPQAIAGTSWLIGSMTGEPPASFFNSALAIMPDGRIPYPYHKRILMPFGEYVPLGDRFPWLRNMSGIPRDLVAGKAISVFEFPLASGESAKVSPLICYEDIIPSLARDSVRAGAELLVNLTNDAWFGNTAAPYQHHIIAAFRAIENRRYLVRSTNSGLTAIVDPSGRTIARIPVFSEGSIREKLNLITDQTVYTRYIGERFRWFLSLVCLLGLALGLRKSAKS